MGFGIVELVSAALACLLGIGLPAAIIFILVKIYERLKSIDEMLKEK